MIIKKIIYRINVIKSLAPFAYGVKRLFALNILLAVIGLSTALIQPTFYSIFIEKVILGRKISLMIYVVLGYILIQAANTAIAFGRNYCGYRINNRVTVSAREKILGNLMKRQFSDYEKLDANETKMIMDDSVFRLCDFTNVQTVDYLINCCKAIILLALLLFLNIKLTAILIVTIPITFFLNGIIGKKEKKVNDDTWKNDQTWGSWMYSAISGWREIRAYTLEEKCVSTFTEYASKYSALFKRFIEYWVSRVLIIPKINDEFLMQFLLYFLGGIVIYRGEITIGTLLLFAQYYTQLVSTVQNVVKTDTDLISNTVYYDKALHAVNEEILSDDLNGYELSGCDIDFRNVTFSYEDTDTRIFDNFNMHIAQGERVGIVGESGRGKTTLLKLIVRLLEPTQGEVLINGRNAKEIPLKKLHERIGIVMQESTLFNTTITENLLYGNPKATKEQMEQACKNANIDEVIRTLPDGYDTVIGEKGIKLSGGEKQRLVLARLFLKDVDVFILDEATSALDQKSENFIKGAIENIGKNKTIIIVSHREKSLSLCDRLIAL